MNIGYEQNCEHVIEDLSGEEIVGKKRQRKELISSISNGKGIINLLIVEEICLI